ncbi:kelch-like protein 21 isoform X1 [Mytilus galloprovincialis]|uniref:kelch-like protein 21 isoform X1 n=2 Tax=Mytilus edulis TaxID=6550 RepID=UPI0039F0ABBD
MNFRRYMDRRIGSPAIDKYVLQDPDYSSEMLNKLNSLRTEKVFTDATVCCGQEEFFCHRNVLAASSPYFRAMFTSELREGKETLVSFNDISAWTMKRIIDYIYTGKLEINTDNVQELLVAGSMLQYEAIVDSCCKFLKCQLDPYNCLGIEKFAQMHSCHRLEEEAYKHALENFSVVTEQVEFLELTVDSLIRYVSSDWIDVRTEEIVYDAVIKWIEFDVDERKKYITQLLENIRLPVIDKHRLSIIKKEPLIVKCEDCVQMVQEAITHNESVHDQHGRRRRSMQNSHVQPRPSTVAKEKMVVIGGINNYVNRTVEMYDPLKDKWFDLPDFPDNISWFSVCALSHSIIVTGGILEGNIVSKVWKFEGRTRAWIAMPPMLKPRARHASGALGELIYVFGGVTYGTTYSVIDSELIECYDPTTQSWTHVGQSVFPRKQSQVVTFSNMLVEVGGLQGEAKVNTMDNFMCIGSGKDIRSAEQFILPEAIQYSKIVVINNIFYIIWEDTKKIIALNPRRRTFERLADMNYAHKHCGATVLGDKIYVVGGLIDNSHNTRPSCIVESYDPVTNKWTIEKSLREPRAHHGCATITL